MGGLAAAPVPAAPAAAPLPAPVPIPAPVPVPVDLSLVYQGLALRFRRTGPWYTKEALVDPGLDPDKDPVLTLLD